MPRDSIGVCDRAMIEWTSQSPQKKVWNLFRMSLDRGQSMVRVFLMLVCSSGCGAFQVLTNIKIKKEAIAICCILEKSSTDSSHQKITISESPIFAK